MPSYPGGSPFGGGFVGFGVGLVTPPPLPPGSDGTSGVGVGQGTGVGAGMPSSGSGSIGWTPHGGGASGHVSVGANGAPQVRPKGA
ncbi:MAG: hypothetical protein OEV61_06280, partial [Chloroflexota bacterium]|nr:hypothetical protein [Chloroflexota bacterium]